MQNSISPAGDNHMPKAIEAIIKEFESMENIHRNSICGVLCDLIRKHMRQSVIFYSKSSEHRRFPQFNCKWYQKNVIEVRIYTSQADNHDSSCENMLRQLSLATVLVGTPADFVDELDPDEIPPVFPQKYPFLSGLADKLFDAMSKVFISE